MKSEMTFRVDADKLLSEITTTNATYYIAPPVPLVAGEKWRVSIENRRLRIQKFLRGKWTLIFSKDVSAHEAIQEHDQ